MNVPGAVVMAAVVPVKIRVRYRWNYIPLGNLAQTRVTILAGLCLRAERLCRFLCFVVDRLRFFVERLRLCFFVERLRLYFVVRFLVFLWSFPVGGLYVPSITDGLKDIVYEKMNRAHL